MYSVQLLGTSAFPRPRLWLPDLGAVAEICAPQLVVYSAALPTAANWKDRPRR